MQRLLIAIVSLVLHIGAFAHSFQVGELHIGHPAARATRPGQPSGGAYLSIENKGKQDDKLLSASSPVAESVQLHTMAMQGDVMKMREVDNIVIRAGEKVSMKPGHGYHIMLMGLKKPLNNGDKFPMTLNFEKAGKVDVTVVVENPEASGSKATGEKPETHSH